MKLQQKADNLGFYVKFIINTYKFDLSSGKFVRVPLYELRRKMPWYMFDESHMWLVTEEQISSYLELYLRNKEKLESLTGHKLK